MRGGGHPIGRDADWRTHPWQDCPKCGRPCRVSHVHLGSCVTCALPVLREEREARAA